MASSPNHYCAPKSVIRIFFVLWDIIKQSTIWKQSTDTSFSFHSTSQRLVLCPWATYWILCPCGAEQDKHRNTLSPGSIMVTVKLGTYRFACGGDLHRLVKFGQDPLLHFAFSERGGWIRFALRNLDQIGFFFCHSSMQAPSCVTWTVPEALGNRSKCQAHSRFDFQQSLSLKK